MSKELDEFYKRYSARIIAIDDTPLVKVMDGGKFKLLSIEEYEEMTNKLADLEAKLAEAQKTIEIQKISNDALQEENLDYRYDITDIAYEQAKEMASNWESQYQEEIKQLKQQLAENKKKKEDFKTMYFNKCLDYEHLHEKFDDKCTEFELKEYDYKQTIFEKEQDKISFAVEQLEKVKEKFISENWDLYDTADLLEQVCELRNEQIKFIDNQINVLRNNKDGIH